jgi:2-keto-4-pentenoate hydratase/2-oxohepta-3-ene-1,7-dioic acid hydratase in catechol pathway
VKLEVTPGTPEPFAGPFAIGTFSGSGETSGEAAFPGLVVPAGQVLDLRLALDDPGLTVLSLLERWDGATSSLHALARNPAGRWRPLAGLRVHAPVRPRQVFQAGANYRQHVIDLELAHRPADDPRTEDEARAEIGAIMDRRAAEDLPYVFTGLPTAITGPYDDVVLPASAAMPDWELELAAVIGRAAYQVAEDDALAVIAGYTMANDLTDRAAVFRKDMPAIGTDWLRGKNAPGFTPLGPWLVPAAFVPDPGNLQVTLTLNGQTMQDESTKDMIFGVARLVSYISQTARLLPGDVVLTGSPAGNGLHWGRLLTAGDIMEGSISGLGSQRTRCVAPGAAQ